jgi:hypothetical protein
VNKSWKQHDDETRIEFLERQFEDRNRMVIELYRKLDLKDAEIEGLQEVIVNLLLSADAEWERRDGGHDWAEACRIARAAIARPTTAITAEWLKKRIETDPDLDMEAGARTLPQPPQEVNNG